MATDLIVAPLRQYFCGDFISPLERLGIGSAATIDLATGKLNNARTGSNPTWWRRFKARRQAQAMQAAFRRASGLQPAWDEDGECAYCNQFLTSHPLAAHAHWLEYQDLIAAPTGPFGSEFTTKLYELERAHKRPILHPHIRACVQSGYFLPMDFAQPVVIGSQTAWGIRFRIRAASTPALLRELELLKVSLGLREPFVWDEFKHSAWVQAMEGWVQIKHAALIAMEKRLPMIVDA